MKLVIVESPGKQKKIGSILGAGYTVVASNGHIRDLPPREIGLAAPEYVPNYVVSERALSKVKHLQSLVARASDVFLATDPDREGEAIAWHLAEVLKIQSAKRVTFRNIETAEVLAGIAAPRPIDMDLVRAQEARRSIDRLVGYQVSDALRRATGNKGLSAGRVQSPAVRLIADRERAIDSFKSTTHYGAELSFGAWKATWNSGLAEGEYLTERSKAATAAAVRGVVVTSFANTQRAMPPPSAFTTSMLQQRAHTALGFKPTHTMAVAQKLYEQGAISYMRTDAQNISPAGFEAIAEYAKANGLPGRFKQRMWTEKEGVQAGHEAIRPTHVADKAAGETPDEKALYKLIWDRAVASQLIDATFAVRTVELASASGAYTFRAQGRTLLNPGWRVIASAIDETPNAADNNPIPSLAVQSVLTANFGRVLDKATQAPKRFTSASLTAEMERIGIGRPSTYATISGSIVDKGYVAEDPKSSQLTPTAAGYRVVDTLVNRFSFLEFGYTRRLEDRLDAISLGTENYKTVVTTTDQQLGLDMRALRLGDRHPKNAVNGVMKMSDHQMSDYQIDKAATEGFKSVPDARLPFKYAGNQLLTDAWHCGKQQASNPPARPQVLATQEKPERIYLNVPYEERKQAKDLGASWDGQKWSVAPTANLEPFERWRLTALEQASRKATVLLEANELKL